MKSLRRIEPKPDPAVTASIRLKELWEEYDALADAGHSAKETERLECVISQERDAVERKLAAVQATTQDGALAQLVLAHGLADILASAEEFSDPNVEIVFQDDLKSLIMSAVSVLARNGADIQNVARAYLSKEVLTD